uniref:Copine domain-containing protein n=1 Tax=Gongylonema pulchrum TaxID=637853 RepID=A0A183DUW7_9BILA
LPLSIIIVGVGGENFENMRKLDSDNELLQQLGRTAQRDIVQFVSLREFLNTKGIHSPIQQSSSAMAHLAKEVLAEVPRQLTSYMKWNGINPRPASDPFPVEPLSETDVYAVGRRLSSACAVRPAYGFLPNIAASVPGTPSHLLRYQQRHQSIPLQMPSSSIGDTAWMPSTSGVYPNPYLYDAAASSSSVQQAPIPAAHMPIRPLQSAPYPTGPPPEIHGMSPFPEMTYPMAGTRMDLASGNPPESGFRPSTHPSAPPGP